MGKLPPNGIPVSLQNFLTLAQMACCGQNQMFRHYFVSDPSDTFISMDVINDRHWDIASVVFVSTLLVTCDMISCVQSTLGGLRSELQDWEAIENPQASQLKLGDILIYPVTGVGIYLGENRSVALVSGTPSEYDWRFNGSATVELALRPNAWL